jgi:hypothetical protein
LEGEHEMTGTSLIVGPLISGGDRGRCHPKGDRALSPSPERKSSQADTQVYTGLHRYGR